MRVHTPTVLQILSDLTSSSQEATQVFGTRLKWEAWVEYNKPRSSKSTFPRNVMTFGSWCLIDEDNVAFECLWNRNYEHTEWSRSQSLQREIASHYASSRFASHYVISSSLFIMLSAVCFALCRPSAVCFALCHYQFALQHAISRLLCIMPVAIHFPLYHQPFPSHYAINSSLWNIPSADCYAWCRPSAVRLWFFHKKFASHTLTSSSLRILPSANCFAMYH